MESSSPPRPRILNRLCSRFSKENKSSPNLLGVKIKRFSEFENYSSCSRGTLGGFLPLPDMGSPDIDSLCLEKQKNMEKECVLTQLTKKIGLGIYTRGRDIAGEKGAREGYVDLDGDERETWYMFYPPPPSPSLALAPKDWESASSPEQGSDSSSAPSVPTVISKTEFEPEDWPRVSTFTYGSQDAPSNPTSPTSATDHSPIQCETNQDIDIDALILSPENLAEQYRGLLLTPNASGSHPRSENGISPLPVSSQLTSPLTFHPPIRPQTPKTLRKIKRQHSLRKLIDDNRASTTSTSTISTLIPITPPSPSRRQDNTMTLPPMTTLTPTTIPTTISTPFTPPLSATKLSPLIPLTPLTSLPAIGSPDFLNTDITPEPLHFTRLSFAAHPNRSPTPRQHRRPLSDPTKPGAKRKNPRGDVSRPPEAPPRESSRGRGRSGSGGGKKGKGKRGGSQGNDGGKAGAATGARRNVEQEGEERKGRGRHMEMPMPRGYGAVDLVDVGGEGWV